MILKQEIYVLVKVKVDSLKYLLCIIMQIAKFKFNWISQPGIVNDKIIEKIIDLNTRALKEYVLKDTDKRNLELRKKEIILNIALGNLGGLYQELIVRKDKADSAKVEQAAWVEKETKKLVIIT